VLDPGQPELLDGHADVVDVPKEIVGTAISTKRYSFLDGASGTVVLIDSDIVVTGRLDEALDLAREGRIVAAPAWMEAARSRWFAECEPTLKLRALLRRKDWFHAGFVVLDVERWPNLPERWWELNELVPAEQAVLDNQPFNAQDADSLNALLMSEISRSALALLPEGDEAFGGQVTIEDIESLRCTVNGRPTRLLHYWDSPKPCQAWAGFERARPRMRRSCAGSCSRRTCRSGSIRRTCLFDCSRACGAGWHFRRARRRIRRSAGRWAERHGSD
jgi:hypothetical protein